LYGGQSLVVGRSRIDEGENMKMKNLRVKQAKDLFCMTSTVFLILALASVTAAAQQSAKKPAVQSQTMDSSKDAKPQTSEEMKITKVEFVSSYQMINTTVTAQPDKVIAVVQTDRQWAKPVVAWLKLSNYVFQYTTADSKTGFVPAVAAGNQNKLPSGSMLQVWIHEKTGSGQPSLISDGDKNFVTVDGDVANGIVEPSQYIGGLAVLAALPKNVTSFTLSIKDIAYVSQRIQRDTEKGLPARK
jgi:hypothetical protein